MKQKLKDCWTLFYLCLIMGATCFGGGYGMIPVMEREFVTKRKYVSESDMADIVSLAQSLPGLISFNTVILISYRKAGILGVISSILGLLIPSLVIISVIVVVYEHFADNKWVNSALKGIKFAVIGVLIYAVVKLSKNSLVKWYHYLIAIFVLLLSLFVDINPIYIIITVGVVFTSACYLNDLITKKKKKAEIKEETSSSTDVPFIKEQEKATEEKDETFMFDIASQGNEIAKQEMETQDETFMFDTFTQEDEEGNNIKE